MVGHGSFVFKVDFENLRPGSKMNWFDYAKNRKKSQPEMSISTILFDLGYTLMYYNAPWPESFKSAGNALLQVLQPAIKTTLDEGIILDSLMHKILEQPDPRDDHRERTSLQMLKIVLKEAGLPALPETKLNEGLKAMFREAEKHWIPEDDTLPVLTGLQDRGYKLAVISNAMDDANVQRLVDKCGIRHLLQAVISSAAFGFAKPNPDIFRYVLELIGSKPQETMMIGDSLDFDVAGAHALGIRAVWITRRVRNWEEKLATAAIKPDVVIGTLSELADIL
jgi:2-haloalkanoic acid dehalogenase type II